MAFVPDSPRRGQDILDWARQVSAFLRATYPRGGGMRTNSTGSSAVALARRAGAPTQVEADPTYRPFELVAASSDDTPSAPRVRVVVSLVDEDTPDGFSATDDPPYLLTPNGGENVVWVVFNLAADGSDVESAEIGHGASVPDDSDSTKYRKFGYYSFDGGTGALIVGNYAFGPVTATICPDPFSNPKTYQFGATFSG